MTLLGFGNLGGAFFVGEPAHSMSLTSTHHKAQRNSRIAFSTRSK